MAALNETKSTNVQGVLLVVLYKCKIMDSSTIESIVLIDKQLISHLKLIIWDNSPMDFYQTQLNVIDYDYYRTPENCSLSVIYNRVLNLYSQASSLFIFDQDSRLTQDYFVLMKDAMKKNPDIGLFVPYVLYGSLIVSPGDYFIYKGRYWKKLYLGRVSSKNKLCIASGMMINIALIRSYGIHFDEHLRFYGIDSQFVLDYSRKNPYFFIINYSLEHNLSLYEKEDFQTKLWRLKSQMNAICYIARKHSFAAFILAYMANIIHFLRLFLCYYAKLLKV